MVRTYGELAKLKSVKTPAGGSATKLADSVLAAALPFISAVVHLAQGGGDYAVVGELEAGTLTAFACNVEGRVDDGADWIVLDTVVHGDYSLATVGGGASHGCYVRNPTTVGTMPQMRLKITAMTGAAQAQSLWLVTPGGR